MEIFVDPILEERDSSNDGRGEIVFQKKESIDAIMKPSKRPRRMESFHLVILVHVSGKERNSNLIDHRSNERVCRRTTVV